MSQLVRASARLLPRSRPIRRCPHAERPAAVCRHASFHSSHRCAAHWSLSLRSSLADTVHGVLTAASSHEHKPRQGLSITEEDDYQQQSPDQRGRQPQSTCPPTQSGGSAGVTSPSSSAPRSSAPAPLPSSAHAYFRVPPSASSSASAAQSAQAGAAGVLQSGQPLVNMANDLTDQFMRAVHLSEQTRFVKGVVLGVSLLAVLSLSAYLFRDSVKTTTAEQVADVAKRSLADSDVQHQVNTMSQDVVHRLLTDQAVLSTALQFSQRLLHEPGTQTALLNLLQRMLADPKTLEWGKEYSGRLVAQLTADENVQRRVAELVKGALMQDNNREALITLLKQTVNDERSLSELRKVGSQSARDVMNDPAVQQHMTDFMKGVLADSSLQQQAGDALWSAVRYSIRPAWTKPASHKDDREKDKHTVRPAAEIPPAWSRPMSAPLATDMSGGAVASAADGLRDAVLMTPARAAAVDPSSLSEWHSPGVSADAHHPPPHAASVPSSPTAASTSAASTSPSSVPSATHSSPLSAASADRSASPSSYLPAPFAVANVDEEDLSPTFTINVVGPHRAHAT